ncbi:hypothetical protein LDC_3108 [sediment metagenome]|uniref:Uncharacterized protein n=1 Tax=sediment metagenome TaxID=749907 RepID=D9PNH5_9ZZZZ
MAEIVIYSNEYSNTTPNDLILDSDDSGGDIIIQFGNVLGEKIYWDNTNTLFMFTDDVKIGGDLDVDGSKITIDADDTGGNMDLIFGKTLNEYLRHTGTWFTFSDDLLMPDAKSIYFRDTALSINSPVDGQLNISADTELEINTPSVDLNGNLAMSGSITGATIDGDLNTIQDIPWSAVKPRPKKMIVDLTDLTLQEDGSSNMADIFTDSETGVSPHEFYVIKTTQASLQDLDIKIKVRVPQDFIDFSTEANDIGFWYKNSGADNTDSKIDILVEDKDGDDAYLASEGQTLFNTSWTAYVNEFDGGSFDPQPGEYILITIKGYASYDGGYQSPYIGEIAFTYTGK